MIGQPIAKTYDMVSNVLLAMYDFRVTDISTFMELIDKVKRKTRADRYCTRIAIIGHILKSGVS